MADTTVLTAQLRALLLLTRTEEQVARTRTAQARTDAVRRELQQNADNAASRTEAITRTLRELGGVPDVVTPALGRLGAVVKATVEQAGPLDEALLSDLSLEHQLLDRATYLKVLAEAAELPRVVRLAERLVAAHTATVEWLTVVLAEAALGGPAALRATPLQRVAGGAARLASMPARYAADSVNKVIDSTQQAADAAQATIDAAAARATTFAGAVRESLSVGRDASLEEAEQQARQQGARDTAEALHETRRELGALDAAELPIPEYDELTVGKAVEAVKKLDGAADLQAVIRYEEEHKDRSSVVSAAQARLAALAKHAVGVS
ncbi:ferritin-like domain-containing protein [Klenkia sp. PcliD-1-E]|uniref:ferritin-like domain-containing protein n=1 Tax=Klenkia sp. PcliD-1-E TaxID=2954492 RepID=UPI002096EC7F|nr:ferritin-like domain-containing protein [Klenkia sp. PcliD-1-E]MCO7218624.1 ferritin-like domain-containing protein [Klenkia sp. PcliD-1-E]